MRRTGIAISLSSEDNASEDGKDNPLVLTVPSSKTRNRRHRDVIAPEGPSRTEVRPIGSDTRTKLVTAIARGRLWLSEIETAGTKIGPLTGQGLGMGLVTIGWTGKTKFLLRSPHAHSP